MGRRRVVLATFPGQGHINPALQFAKRLLNAGTDVTFFTSVYASRRMAISSSAASPPGLDFVSFSDGYDDGLKPGGDSGRFMSEMKSRGREALRGLLLRTDATFLVYSHLFSWAAEVARDVHLPSALLWVEPATVLCIYHFYFNGHAAAVDAGSDDIRLPHLPPLKQRDLPTFLLPETPERFKSLMREKLETLDAGRAEDEKVKVLVNTFDALEPDALRAVDRYELMGIGPLIPTAYLDGRDPTDRSYGGDLFRTPDDYGCASWLEAQPPSSVVYVSFGSVLKLPKAQMEGIAEALLACARPFLWVIQRNEDEEDRDEEELSVATELGKLGKIVRWCAQLEILGHGAVGCFVTHCGWNSAVESLSLGVPVVAVPQWFDQGTNAKLMEDVWGCGVRVEGGGGGELRRCIEMVMDGGEKSRVVRENARKWKDLATEAMADNGSSFNNIHAFLQQI
ncbi:anthocyanidin 3-O-glucoside 5-O-glucosyltransferase 1-like [Salvia splendens]|uniref:anthocyanidin 3-O-glucoside 5-O-glucosyltransferase 1-like n=1 Tax=Salvia splendens TaxID=180675 RepID=UPI0010FFE50D|nr:anthocyanidin 3-O-glucoside 5-O-glucosyltransferase 1-like [Salvia splendens]